MHVGDLAKVPETAVYLQRRSELGLPITEEAPLAVTEDGSPVSHAEIDDYLVRIRGIASAPVVMNNHNAWRRVSCDRPRQPNQAPRRSAQWVTAGCST